MATTDSARRTVTLVASIVIALSAGTNYVYSAYAPQLGHQLGLNHAQLNMIGFGGNAGNYLAGPFWGRVVDSRGPRVLLCSAFICLLCGYLAIRQFYDGALSLPTDTSSTLTPAVVALALLEFLTGVGSNAAITAALNTTAKSFPDSLRATVTGLVISGFGLSAFFFSAIAHIAFPGNTTDFLLLLAIGTAIPPFSGIFFLQPVPHAEHPDHTDPIPSGGADSAVGVFTHVVGPSAYERLDDYEEIEDDQDNWQENAEQARRNSGRFLSRLSRSFSIGSEGPAANKSRTQEEDSPTYALATSPPSDGSFPSHPRDTSRTLLLPRAHRHVLVSHPDINGWALLRNNDFWLMFVILSLLSGTGLMWINNVGSITQALFINGNGTWDEHNGSKEQAAQVSITSLGNCLGRALIGLFADFARNRWSAPRVYLLTLVSFTFLLSQLLAMSIEDLPQLWRASSSLGLAYGGAFGLLPVITIEWFGLGHFSQNWGFVSIAPVIAGNLFSLAFGKNLDSHASSPPNNATLLSPRHSEGGSFVASPLPEGVHSRWMMDTAISKRGGLPSELLCYEGRACYIASLKMTTVACTVALGLSLYAAWRDRQKIKATRTEVWDEGDDGPSM